MKKKMPSGRKLAPARRDELLGIAEPSLTENVDNEAPLDRLETSFQDRHLAPSGRRITHARLVALELEHGDRRGHAHRFAANDVRARYATDVSDHKSEERNAARRDHRHAAIICVRAIARWVPAASTALTRSLGRLRRWEDVPWIGWDRDLASFAPARWLAQQAPRAQLVLRTSHMAAQLGAARAGLAALLVPTPYLAMHELEALRLGRKLAAGAAAAPVDDLWLVGHRALRDVPRVAAVWEFFTEEMRAIARRSEAAVTAVPRAPGKRGEQT